MKTTDLSKTSDTSCMNSSTDRLQLNRYLQDVIAEAMAAGIPVRPIEPEVVVNKRAHSFWGRCSEVRECSKAGAGRYSGASYRIEVTTKLLGTDEAGIKNTLMHEVLHTCEGCMNHSRLWKYYASIVNTKYGYNIKRVTTPEEKGIIAAEDASGDRVSSLPVRYIVTCTRCGLSQGYKRAGKVVTRPQNYRCRCGGKLLVKNL